MKKIFKGALCAAKTTAIVIVGVPLATVALAVYLPTIIISAEKRKRALRKELQPIIEEWMNEHEDGLE